MQAILTIETGIEGYSQPERRWIRAGQQLSIGSSSWADFVLESPKLLPIHLLLDLSDSGCVLYGVESGEFMIGGNLSQASARLADGDLIEAGGIRLRLQLHGCRRDQHCSSPSSRFPLENHVLPSNHRLSPAPIALATCDIGNDYVRFLPTQASNSDGSSVAKYVADHVPLFGLCRFDRWSFPIPPELAGCSDSIPAAAGSNTDYLPILFDVTLLEDPWAFVASGLASEKLILLASQQGQASLLEFLRAQAGIFLSPTALQSILDGVRPESLPDILGPVCCVLLGSNANWVLLSQREIISSSEQAFSSKARTEPTNAFSPFEPQVLSILQQTA